LCVDVYLYLYFVCVFTYLLQLHRLPALLVDDFAEITPELLRQAYVEAVYRADEFEFERLKQTYWWEIISQVARNRTTAKLLDYLPAEAQDITFARPKEPFTCAATGSCGPGTKRTPRKSC